MNASTILDRLQTAARLSKDDAQFNLITSLVHRLAHQGAPFEKPLTRSEIAEISKYAGLNG